MEGRLSQPPAVGQLVTQVDSLRAGSLSPTQAEMVRVLRNGLLALAQENIEDVKLLR